MSRSVSRSSTPTKLAPLVKTMNSTQSRDELKSRSSQSAEISAAKPKQRNALASDKWTTAELLVAQISYALPIRDGRLVDRTAIIVTGRPVPSSSVAAATSSIVYDDEETFESVYVETLHDAVQKALPGQMVFVQQGQHFVGSQPVLLSRPVMVVGHRRESALADPEERLARIPEAERLKYPDYCEADLEYDSERSRIFADYGTPIFVVSSSGVELRGLTISQRLAYKVAPARAAQRGHFCAVEFTSGSSLMLECTLSSDAGLGVKVHSNADPTIRKCKILYTRQEGVWFSGSACRGRLEDSSVQSCGGANVHVEDGADPVIYRNRILKSPGDGVYITRRGKGTLTRNIIFECAGACLRIDDESDPIVRDNDIHSGLGSGVVIQDNGLGTLERNEIRIHNGSGLVCHRILNDISVWTIAPLENC
mmetsp:Transcript_88811/g.236427  ORF Transcript_88811/g.236427 Transcript_88811/m.236427 type:complete len:424 (+) Transcript_88811:64-1335(+)